jgi:hypothetical protein
LQLRRHSSTDVLLLFTFGGGFFARPVFTATIHKPRKSSNPAMRKSQINPRSLAQNRTPPGADLCDRDMVVIEEPRKIGFANMADRPRAFGREPSPD